MFYLYVYTAYRAVIAQHVAVKNDYGTHDDK